MLTQLYPSHHWELWKFTQVPKNFWDKKANVAACLKTLEKTLNINTMDDWYSVKMKDIEALAGLCLAFPLFLGFLLVLT